MSLLPIRPETRSLMMLQMLFAVVLSSMNPIFTKILFSEGWDFMTLYFAVMIVIVGVLLIHEVIALERGVRWGMTKEDIVGTVVTAVLGGFASPLLFFWGLQHVSASEAIIMTSVLPFFVVCFAVLLLGERFHLREVVGGLMLAGGLVALLWEDILAFHLSEGVPVILLSSFVGALSIILHKKFVKHRHLDSVVLVRNVIGLVLLGTTIAIVQPESFRTLAAPQNIWFFLALPICAYLIPFFLFYRAIRHVKATDVGLMEAAGRVVGIVAASAILGEALEKTHFISILLIIGGIVFVNVPLTKWRIVPSRLIGIDALRK